MSYKFLAFALLSFVSYIMFASTVFGQTKTGVTVVVPTASPIPGNTIVKLAVFLHGIGKGGDNANSAGGGTQNPIHQQRPILAEVYNNRGELLMQQEGVIVFDQATGGFAGYIDLGPGFPSGTYFLKVRTSLYLRKQIGYIQSLQSNTINVASAVTLTAGDTNGDNKINILDYNQIIRCYTKSRLCTPIMRENTDINDDGVANQVDYNLFLREVWIQPGQ